MSVPSKRNLIAPFPAPPSLPEQSNARRRARSKPPQARSVRVVRPRLAQWIEEALASPITLIRAPAGYGKTTLLTQFAEGLSERHRAVRWLSVSASDRAPHHFLESLCDACALPAPAAGLAVERQMAHCIDTLANLTPATAILLDDVDRVNQSQTSALLYELIDLLPDNVHIVCTTRVTPDFSLAKARSYGRLAELRTPDLSFDVAQVLSLLALLGIKDAQAVEVERLVRLTEGWPMIIQHELQRLRGDLSLPDIIDSVTGRRRDIADYFQSEVLRGERPEMIRVLEAIAITDAPNGALAAAVSGLENAPALLEEASERSLFFDAGDDGRGRYRLHKLFAETLRQQLEQRSASQAAEFHRRAADWYEGAGQLMEAVDHAIQGADPARAARIFDSRSDEFYETGQEAAILPVASRIPAGLRRQHPRLLLAMSWRLLAEWEFEKSRVLLARAEDRIGEMADSGECSAGDLLDLRHQLLHGQIMLAQFEDDFAFIDKHADPLLRLHSEMSPYVRGSLCTAMIAAAREQYRFARLDSLEALARRQFQAVSSRYVAIFLEAIIAPGYLSRGRTDEAMKTLGATTAAALQMAGPSLASLVALPLAEVMYDRAELDESQALIDSYLPHATQIGFADQLISGYLTRSRIARLRGETDTALRALDDGIRFARERSFHRLTHFLVAEQIDLLCRLGRADEASKAGTTVGLRRTADCVLPVSRNTRARSALAYAWTSIALARGRVPDAVRVARKWRHVTDIAGALRDSARWSVRLAIGLERAGDGCGARRELRRTIQAASRAGLKQVFLEEVDALAPLLQDLDGDGNASPPLMRDQAVTLLLNSVAQAARVVPDRPAPTAVQSPDPGYPIPTDGALSGREIQVLMLVAEGFSNAEIGQRLNLVEGSIKWHLHRIFDKLGTRRRMVAVERARRAGILPGADTK
jgi:LuxR family transcriptional regulator, maltose regulon positive regulatory protein